VTVPELPHIVSGVKAKVSTGAMRKVLPLKLKFQPVASGDEKLLIKIAYVCPAVTVIGGHISPAAVPGQGAVHGIVVEVPCIPTGSEFDPS
jgi:hypothetical protein